jgi:predicted phage terminase large subunit-like protein
LQVERTENFIANGLVSHNTRWHHDDLSGRILREQREAYSELQEKIEYLQKHDADEVDLMLAYQELDAIEDWDTIVFPAIAESDEFMDRKGKLVHVDGKKHRKLRSKGEALHPERYPLSDLLKKKRTLQPRHWTALYQQNPTPDDGDFFKREMFRYEGDIDFRMMTILIAWDLAIGVKQQNDWTVGTVGALDWDGDLHIIDQVRFRSAELAKPILDLGQKYHPVLIGIEKGQLEKAIMPELKRQMQQRRYFPPFAEGKEALVPVTDKVIRARPLQGLMQNGKVHFPAHQPWVEGLVAEFLQFPNGLHDVRVDSLAWLARMAATTSVPKAPADRFRAKKVPSWKDKLLGVPRKDPMAA